MVGTPPLYKVLTYTLKLKLFSALKSSKTLNELCLVFATNFDAPSLLLQHGKMQINSTPFSQYVLSLITLISFETCDFLTWFNINVHRTHTVAE
jgi:hypothetical protein